MDSDEATEGLPALGGASPLEKGLAKPDVRAVALLDQLNAVDARYGDPDTWRVWAIPVSSVLVLISMAMLGVSFRDPMGLLIYALMAAGPLSSLVIRHRARRAMRREREELLAKHERALLMAAEYREKAGEGDGP